MNRISILVLVTSGFGLAAPMPDTFAGKRHAGHQQQSTPRPIPCPYPGKDGDSQAYVISGSGQFGVVDLATGTFKLVGMTTATLSGLGRGSRASLYGLDADNNLVTINTANSTTTVVGNIGLPVQPNGNITLFAGTTHLFALDPANNLYSVAPGTAQLSFVGSIGVPVPNFDTCNCVSANSLAVVDGDLYFIWEILDLDTNLSIVPSALYRIDPHTGVANKVGLTHAPGPIVGSGFVDDTFFAFALGVPDGQPNPILAIDLETGKASVVAQQDASLDPVFGALGLTKHDLGPSRAS